MRSRYSKSTLAALALSIGLLAAARAEAGSVEVFDDATGKTTVFIGDPGIIKGFNPQPDPPGNPCVGG